MADTQANEESKSNEFQKYVNLSKELKQRAKLILVKNRQDNFHQEKMNATKQKHKGSPPKFKPQINEESKKIFNKLLMDG